MRSIEIKSNGYTYRYDFGQVDSTEETFNPERAIKIEPISNAEECLRICLGFLDAIFSPKEVNSALNGIVISERGKRL